MLDCARRNRNEGQIASMYRIVHGVKERRTHVDVEEVIRGWSRLGDDRCQSLWGIFAVW